MKPEDLIPVEKPAYGPETAQVVLDIITTFPDNHDQIIYECGTTRCIAGWTMAVHYGSWRNAFLSSLDVPLSHAEEAAGKMLGLSASEASTLFHTMDDKLAVEALKYVAKGESIPWDELRKRQYEIVDE